MKLILFLLLTLSTKSIHKSCECFMSPIETDFHNSEFVFTGKIIQVLDTSADAIKSLNLVIGMKAKALVLHEFKTKTLNTDTLEFTTDSTNCDPFYQLGQSYLFFAKKVENGKYKMIHCTHWGLLQDANEDIRKLYSLTK